MKISLERKPLLGAAAAVLVVLSVGTTAWWNVARFEGLFDRVDHTHRVLHGLEQVLTDVLSMQTSVRGYVLTGSDEILNNYRAGLEHAASSLRNLRTLTVDNPLQQRNLDRLEPLVAQAEAIMDERVADRRDHGAQAIRNTEAFLSGQEIVNGLRGVVETMEAEERGLLLARISASRSAARTVNGTITAVGVLAAIVVTIAGYVIRRDFRRRREAEEVVRQAEERSRLMVSAIKDYAIIRLNPDGCVASWNEGAQQIIGYTSAEIIGQHFSRLSPPELVADGLPAQALATANRENRYEFEGWRPRRDGSRFWANAVITALRDRDGNLVGFVKVTRDLTERRRIEQMHVQFRALFESLPGLYLVLTPDLEIVAVSDAYLKATMTTREGILGRPLFAVFPDNPDDPAASGATNLRASLNRVRESGLTDQMAIQKYDVRRPDGVFEERYWSPINSPVLGVDRRLEYIIHRVEDVTEFVRQKSHRAEDERVAHGLRSRLEHMEAEIFRGAQQVQATNEKLHAANAELEAFSYSVSHDLRAPLRHIDGFAGLLSRHAGPALDEKARRYLTTISTAAKQMGRLIDELLAFSRCGRTPLRETDVDQNELVAEVIRQGHYGTDGRVIAWDIRALPNVRADPSTLRQVWANLIENAVKYSGKSPQPQIVIGCQLDETRPGEHVFFVRDNGVGFDMAYVGKLFGVFQRLHGPAEFEGTGIGLALVRRIVSRHGGRTWAEGRLNQGATFFFSLPIHSPRADNPAGFLLSSDDLSTPSPSRST